MTKIIKADFDGSPMQFNPDGWFNATLAAERFGKSPYEWQRLPETVRYMQALESKYGEIPYLKTKRGNAGGTWLHPKLAVRFAQWLDIDFAIWCDEQVDALIRGTGDGWNAARAGAAQQHRGGVRHGTADPAGHRQDHAAAPLHQRIPPNQSGHDRQHITAGS